jgi:sugar/nucleoside kinase (ribokinase family)
MNDMLNIEAIRWLQVTALQLTNPNDADFGAKVRELVKKHENQVNTTADVN